MEKAILAVTVGMRARSILRPSELRTLLVETVLDSPRLCLARLPGLPEQKARIEISPDGLLSLRAEGRSRARPGALVEVKVDTPSGRYSFLSEFLGVQADGSVRLALPKALQELQRRKGPRPRCRGASLRVLVGSQERRVELVNLSRGGLGFRYSVLDLHSVSVGDRLDGHLRLPGLDTMDTILLVQHLREAPGTGLDYAGTSFSYLPVAGRRWIDAAFRRAQGAS